MLRFLKNMFSGGNQPLEKDAPTRDIEHCMLLIFRPAPSVDRLFEIEDLLIDLFRDGHVGEVDGNDISIDGTESTIYVYGPDAKTLYATAQDLRGADAELNTCHVYLRFGNADDAQAPEIRFPFGNDPDWPQ